MIELIPVSSSNISAIGYDESQNVLQIEFNNGRLYEYYGVPPYVFNELLGAGSKGTYANQNIYKNYLQNQLR